MLVSYAYCKILLKNCAEKGRAIGRFDLIGAVAIRLKHVCSPTLSNDIYMVI